MRSLKGILEDLREASESYAEFQPGDGKDSEGRHRDSVAYGIELAIDIVKRGYVADANPKKVEDLLEANLQFVGAEVEEITHYVQKYYHGNSKEELTQFFRTAILDTFRKGYHWGSIRKLAQSLLDLGSGLLASSVKLEAQRTLTSSVRKRLIREGISVYDDPLKKLISTNSTISSKLQESASNCNQAAMVIMRIEEDEEAQKALPPADSEYWDEEDWNEEDVDLGEPPALFPAEIFY